MKKILLMMTAALLVVSCENGPDEPKGPKYPEPEKGATYQLEGTVNTEGFTWTSTSVVGLYSQMDEVRASNLACRIVGYTDPSAEAEEGVEPEKSPYEGKAVARFNTPAMDLVKGENSFLVYTPYNPELLYLAGMIYGLTIAEEQTQNAPNVAGSSFAIGTATGVPGVDEAFKFEMTPITALAKFTVSSSEFAGFAPSKITVYDEDGADLAGGFNVKIEDLSFQTLETHKRASVTVKNPVALTASSKQNIYLNLLPNDFTGKELWIIVEFDGAKGHVTIPMKKSGLKFEAGQTTEVDLSNISSNDNAAKDWYEPMESRYLSGPGVAYGDANTYFIQCKNGQTYTGATYQANADIPSEIKIDIKARGNFFSDACIDPRGATFEWYTTANGSTYLPRTANYTNGVDPSKFEFTYDNNTTVTVKNTGAFAGAPILVMKKDGKVLWAWAFWNVAADGTKVETVNIGQYQLANMDIGQPTTQYTTWIANKDTGGNPDVVYRMHHLYQWGRPIPIFWTTYWTTDLLATGTAGNVPTIWGPLSLEEALANPVGVIVGDPSIYGSDGILQWQTDTIGDLWGNQSQQTDAVGKKSIYDPCPKGWRVPDRNVFEALVALTPAEGQGYTYEDTAGMAGIRLNGNLFLTQGYINGKVDAGNGRYATMGGGASGTAAQASHGLIWSNYIGSASANQPTTLYYRSSNGKAAPRVAGYNRVMSAAVRCQKDTDNR